jgi:hypothetical protein
MCTSKGYIDRIPKPQLTLSRNLAHFSLWIEILTRKVFDYEEVFSNGAYVYGVCVGHSAYGRRSQLP